MLLCEMGELLGGMRVLLYGVGKLLRRVWDLLPEMGELLYRVLRGRRGRSGRGELVGQSGGAPR